MKRFLEVLQDCAPLVLRLVGGVIFTVHGFQKVFGGMDSFSGMVAAINLPPNVAYPGAFLELVGGVLLMAGLLVRLTALLLAGQMTVAVIKFHILYLKQGLAGGFELPLALLAIAAALVCLGSGALSLDRRLFGWK